MVLTKIKLKEYLATLAGAAEKSIGPEISVQERGDAVKLVREYYQDLKKTGDVYGAAALQVVNNEGFFGKFANTHLAMQARFEGTPEVNLPEIRDRIMIGLAYADMSARAECEGFKIELRQISEYHYDVFRKVGLSEYSWGGHAVEKLIGEGQWIAFYKADEFGIRKMVDQLSQIDQDGKIDGYSVARMISSMVHTFDCVVRDKETPYAPEVRGKSVQDIANRWGVEIDRIEEGIEEIPTEEHGLTLEFPVFKILPVLPALSEASSVIVPSKYYAMMEKDRNTESVYHITALMHALKEEEDNVALQLVTMGADIHPNAIMHCMRYPFKSKTFKAILHHPEFNWDYVHLPRKSGEYIAHGCFKDYPEPPIWRDFIGFAYNSRDHELFELFIQREMYVKHELIGVFEQMHSKYNCRLNPEDRLFYTKCLLGFEYLDWRKAFDHCLEEARHAGRADSKDKDELEETACAILNIVDIEFKNGDAHTACGLGYVRLLEMLVSKGADPFITSRGEQLSPYFIALGVRNIRLVHELIKLKIDVNVHSYDEKRVVYLGPDAPEDRHLLAVAIERQEKEIFIILNPLFSIEHRAKAMQYAISYDKVDFIKILVESGIDINTVTSSGQTALLRAIQVGDTAFFDYALTIEGIDLDRVEHEHSNNIPLRLAMYQENIYMMKRLIEEGADINHRDFRGGFISEVFYLRNEEIMRVLINHPDVELSCRDSDGPLLYRLIREYSEEFVLEVLDTGKVDLSYVDGAYRSPLHHAIKFQKPKVVKALLVLNPDLVNSDFATYQYTPIAEALSVDFAGEEICDALIEAGADLDRDYKFNSFIYNLSEISIKCIESYKYLLYRGFFSNGKIQYGRTTFDTTYFVGRYDYQDKLLELYHQHLEMGGIVKGVNDGDLL